MRIEYEVARSTQDHSEWRVEAFDYDDEGQCYVAIFTGPGAEERAREYADFKNGQSQPISMRPLLRRLWHRLLGHGSTAIGQRGEWQGDTITWTNSNVCRTCYLYLDSTDF